MNPNTATNEELRDWLATKLHGFVKTGFVGFHPIPNTIDAAAKCLPDGWTEYAVEVEWFSINGKDPSKCVCVDRTTDEATDRFRLAVKAIMATEESK